MHMNPQTSDTDFPVNKTPTLNANHQKQPRLFSTKKKRVMPKRWAKPSKGKRDTVRRKILTGENIDEFDEFPAICVNIFPIKIFHLVSYLYEINE